MQTKSISEGLSSKELDIKGLSYFFIIGAAILWGTLGIFAKSLTGFGFTPIQIVFIRAIVAFITLFLLIQFKDKNLLKIKPRDSFYFIGTGILSFVFFNWCYFIAINKTSLSVAAILLYTAPAIVMVLSTILFKEKLTRKKVFSLLLTLIGCILVAAFTKGSGAQGVSMLGILAGLGSGHLVDTP